MKTKISFLIISYFFLSNLFGQNWIVNGNTGISNTNFIGTTDNQQLKIKTNGITRLTVGTNIGAVNPGAITIGDLDPDIAPNYGGMLRIKSSNNTTALDLIRSTNSASTGWDNQIRFYNYNNLRHLIADDYSSGKLVIAPGSDASSGSVNIVDVRGRMQIGDDINAYPTPSGYSLYVQYGILTEKVKVAIKTTSDWSDFVFDKNYNLRPLSEVEKYIKQNNHLPDVPSAADMVKEGNDLGKTDALLLQKIEELTLYMIELKKENELMKKQIQALQKQ
jgi:trimeric autotransporter adhesin